MSAYDERPWLALYGDQPADYDVEFDNALDMFRAGLAKDPGGDALNYFDGTISRQELDELSDALAAGLLANGFSAGDRLAVYLQNVPQFVIAMVATWKAGGVMVSINPMSRKRELSYLLKDSGATVLVSLEALYDEVARDVVPDTDVRLVLTTSELDFQTRNDERLFGGTSRQRHEGTTDFREFIEEHRGQQPPPVAFVRGRRRVPDLHLGDDRRAQGSDEHPRERHLHRAGLPGLDARRAGRRDLRHRAAVPHHRAHRAHRGEHARAGAADPGLPVRAAGRPRRLRRAPAGVHHRRHHGAQRAARRAGVHQGPLLLVHVGLLRGRGDLPDRGEGVPGGDRHPGAQRLRADRDHVADDGDAVRLAVTGRPDVRRPVGRVRRRRARSSASRTTTVRTCRSARSARSSPTGRRWSRATGASRTRRRPTCPGGALKSGDVGFMNPEGWVFIVDRKKDMINASGYKVWPREVEDVLAEHPAVRESAVVGVPDEKRGETVKAFVSVKAGSDGDRGGAHRALQGAHGRLQVPAADRDHRRAAQDGHRQDPPPGAARPAVLRLSAGPALARLGGSAKVGPPNCARGGTSMSDTVTRDDAGGVATLTLQRPGLSHALRTDLLAAVEAVAADESVRAVLITGTGRAFCVGQDLAEHLEALRGQRGDVAERGRRGVQPADPGAGRAARAGRRRHQRRVRRAPGSGIALAGDLRIAAAGAKFTTAFTGVGLSSDSALAVAARALRRRLPGGPAAADAGSVHRRDGRAVGAGAPRRPGRAGARRRRRRWPRGWPPGRPPPTAR